MSPQHLEALERANRIRLARAELKRDVAAGRRTVAAVLLDVPECAAGMTAYDLLRAQRQWGRSRTLRLLGLAAVRESRRVGDLTDRQRETIAAWLT